jgi:hypothetical protein
MSHSMESVYTDSSSVVPSWRRSLWRRVLASAAFGAVSAAVVVPTRAEAASDQCNDSACAGLACGQPNSYDGWHCTVIRGVGCVSALCNGGTGQPDM